MSTARATKAPLKFSTIFGEMLAQCPAQIQSYGACIAKHADSVSKDACAKEFAQLRACSQQVIARARGKR
jgi:hypothetical protein